jgi:cation diffusion facilitator family transporter
MKEKLTLARSQSIVRASWVGIIGNGILAALKIVVGFLSGSMAVIGDGIDSSTDIITSIITLVAGRIVAKPPDIEHPYGHSRAETIATKSLSFIIFFAGAQLGLSALQRLRGFQGVEIPQTVAIYVTVLSILGKAFLAAYKFRTGRETGSSMLIADAKNMRNDIVVSVAVLCGLIFTFLLQTPILDSVTALLVSIWIMKVAFGIFLETNAELMEGHEDRATYQSIFDAVGEVKGASHPHRARIRKIGNMYIVDLDIEVDGALTVLAAHRISQETEQKITERIGNVYDVLVHVEPLGNVEHAERYGVSQRKLDGRS